MIDMLSNCGSILFGEVDLKVEIRLLVTVIAVPEQTLDKYCGSQLTWRLCLLFFLLSMTHQQIICPAYAIVKAIVYRDVHNLA